MDTEARIAVLVDCDNTTPEVLEYGLKVVAQFGRVVLRRGYGNHGTLAHKWQDALVQLAFTPCLQFQFAAGKNTSDIALALDAIEALFDERASIFCIVTSDSDFAHLCRKLRERGATVYVVGEGKTPGALRNASDQFFEWTRSGAEDAGQETAAGEVTAKAPGRAEQPRPAPKLRPRFVVEAVALLAANTPEGKVSVGGLGSYLKRADPSFSPKAYGHSGLLDMLKTYDLLKVQQEPGGHWTTYLAQQAAA